MCHAVLCQLLSVVVSLNPDMGSNSSLVIFGKYELHMIDLRIKREEILKHLTPCT